MNGDAVVQRGVQMKPIIISAICLFLLLVQSIVTIGCDANVNDPNESSSEEVAENSSESELLESSNSSESQDKLSSDKTEDTQSNNENASSEAGESESSGESPPASSPGESSQADSSEFESSGDLEGSSAEGISSSIDSKFDSLNTVIDEVFDDGELNTYEVILPQSSLDAMDERPIYEEYFMGTFIAGIDTIHDVKIRYKGSYGAWFYGEAHDFKTFCADWYILGKKCTKLSLKVKFNTDAYPERRFHGMKKVQLHAMNDDFSQLRDRLGYWVFREMGVRTARCVNAKVKINGEYNGIFAMIEQLDGRFTRANFDNGGGNLYKQMMPTNAFNQAPDDSVFFNRLKTNEDEDPQFDLIRSLAFALQDADDNTITDVLEEYLDIEEAVTMMAVGRAIQHWDGPWTPWDPYGHGNNSYMYSDTDRNKITLIPWDLDNILQQRMLHPAFDKPVTPEAGYPMHEECDDESTAARCSRFLIGLTKFPDEYRAAVEKYRDDVFPRALEKIEEWREQIRAATIEMNTIHGDPTPGDDGDGMMGAISESFWDYEVDFMKENFQDGANTLFEYLNM